MGDFDIKLPKHLNTFKECSDVQIKIYMKHLNLMIAPRTAELLTRP